MTTPAPEVAQIRRLGSQDLGAGELAQLLDLFTACWPDGSFTDDDVAHAMGGVHWLAESAGRIVGHVSVVSRDLRVGGRPLHTGYVEGVAVHPHWQRRGVASSLMARANAHIRQTYQLGALSTGVPVVFARVGWERWRGPTFVRTTAGDLRTPEEDDGILVLRTPTTPLDFDVSAPISCEERAGDSW